MGGIAGGVPPAQLIDPTDKLMRRAGEWRFERDRAGAVPLETVPGPVLLRDTQRCRERFRGLRGDGATETRRPKSKLRTRSSTVRCDKSARRVSQRL